MFRVGQEVICIDSKDPMGVGKHFSQWVELNKEYTVRRVEGSLHGKSRILLEEVKNPSILFEELGGKAEPGFAAERFRAKADDFADSIEEKLAEELEYA